MKSDKVIEESNVDIILGVVERPGAFVLDLIDTYKGGLMATIYPLLLKSNRTNVLIK